jgi:formylmethanofuran dehydrogenase subunit C
VSITLTLHTQPEVPLEAEHVSPDGLAGLSADEIARLPLQYGNQTAALGEFFAVTGTGADEVRVVGELRKVKLLGAAMSGGRLVVEGVGGMHLGAAMRGGVIDMHGDAGDWVGAEMSGGRIVVHGNAGHMLGSAYRGSRKGMTGGEIIVHGNAGNEIGGTMRRGTIAVGGDTGDFVGVNMLAGTIVVLGALGWRAGAGLKRGTIATMHPARVLPTFNYDCAYQPTFLRMYLRALRAAGLPIADEQIGGYYKRWSGDMLELGRGELLVLDTVTG